MKSSETVVFNVTFLGASLPGMCPLPPQDMLTKRKKLEQEAEKKRLEEEVRNAFVAGE